MLVSKCPLTVVLDTVLICQIDVGLVVVRTFRLWVKVRNIRVQSSGRIRVKFHHRDMRRDCWPVSGHPSGQKPPPPPRSTADTTLPGKGTFVFGTDVYPHMPIIRPHVARHCVRELKGNRCERRGGGGAMADSSDFGLMGEQSSHS